MSRALALILLLTVLLLPSTALAADVAILDDGTDPDPVTVDVGEPVVMTNEGADDVRLIDQAGRWDSGVLAPGESFTITFDVAGTVEFASEDGSVEGVIEVTDGDPMGTPATDEPTEEPADEPTDEPAADPTDEPVAEPTQEPAVTELAATGAPAVLLAALALGGIASGGALLRRRG